MTTPAAEPRYQLTILGYSHSQTLSKLSELIYRSQDQNLIASMSSLPYVVGRSFSIAEAHLLHTELKNLKVSHRFKSDQTGATEFVFDLSKKETPIAPSTPISKYRPKLWQLMTLIAVAAIAIFQFKSRPSNNTEDSEAFNESYEAKIEHLNRDVEYRGADSYIWSKAITSQKLQAKDSLRTFQDSSAVLTYRSGSRLNVQPNTLIIIGDSPIAGNNRLDLRDGTLQARVKSSAKSEKFSIETKSGTLELESPTEGAKETKVETSLSKGTLTVSVTQGTVRLQPSAKNATVVTLKSLEQITATAESVTTPTPFVPKIDLIQPGEDTKLISDPQKSSPHLFQWKDIGEPATYELILASDSKMSSVFLRQKTTSAQIELSYIDEGEIYWRVDAVADGVTYSSPARRIHVEKPRE